MAKEPCVRRSCRRRVEYILDLRPLVPSYRDDPEQFSTSAPLQRWKLCAVDRDRVQKAINSAVEEVI